MKRFGILGLALALFALPAMAGDGKHQRGPAPEEIAARLGLDSDQTEQFTTIMQEQHDKQRAQGEALREQGVSRRSDEARAAHKAIREETRQRLSGVLNPEQLEKLESMRGERRHKQRERMRERDEAQSDTL
jgi:hypothetical protein